MLGRLSARRRQLQRWCRTRGGGGSALLRLSPLQRAAVIALAAFLSGALTMALLALLTAPRGRVATEDEVAIAHTLRRHGTLLPPAPLPAARTARALVLDQIAVGIKSGREVQRRRLSLAWTAWLSRAYGDLRNVVIVSDVAHPANSPGEPTPLESVDLRRVAAELLAETTAAPPPAQNASLDVDSSGMSAQLLAMHMPALGTEMRGLFRGGWSGDKDKNLPALAYLYARFPRRRVYLLIDDDTFMFVDGLVHALRHDRVLRDFWDAAFEAPRYGGRLFLMVNCMGYRHGDGSNPKFAHGGSGIALNHAAMAALRPHVPRCLRELPARCYAGDMQVAVCLARHAGVRAVRKVLPFTGEHLSWAVLGPPASSRSGAWLWNSTQLRVATMHQLPEHELRLLTAFEHDTAPENRSFRALKLYALAHNLTFTPRKWWRSQPRRGGSDQASLSLPPAQQPVPLERRR